MAIFLLGPDPQGQCCDCSQRASPCDSCQKCSLELPPQRLFNPNAVYSNIYEALSVLSNDVDTKCYTYRSLGGEIATSFFNNTLSIIQSRQGIFLSGGQTETDVVFKLNIIDTSVNITIDVSCSLLNTNRINIQIYKSSGEFVSQYTYNQSSINTNISLPSPGQYVFIMLSDVFFKSSGETTVTTNANFASPSANVCLVSAAYQNSDGDIVFVTCSDLP